MNQINKEKIKKIHEALDNLERLSSPSQPEWDWKKEFDEQFVRKDGLMDKYGYDEKGDTECMATLIKSFIQKVSESSKEEGRNSCRKEKQLVKCDECGLIKELGKILEEITEYTNGKGLCTDCVKNKTRNEERQSILKLIEGMEKKAIVENGIYEQNQRHGASYFKALSDLKNLINKR